MDYKLLKNMYDLLKHYRDLHDRETAAYRKMEEEGKSYREKVAFCEQMKPAVDIYDGMIDDYLSYRDHSTPELRSEIIRKHGKTINSFISSRKDPERKETSAEKKEAPGTDLNEEEAIKEVWQSEFEKRVYEQLSTELTRIASKTISSTYLRELEDRIAAAETEMTEDKFLARESAELTEIAGRSISSSLLRDLISRITESVSEELINDLDAPLAPNDIYYEIMRRIAEKRPAESARTEPVPEKKPFPDDGPTGANIYRFDPPVSRHPEGGYEPFLPPVNRRSPGKLSSAKGIPGALQNLRDEVREAKDICKRFR